MKFLGFNFDFEFSGNFIYFCINFNNKLVLIKVLTFTNLYENLLNLHFTKR